MWRKSIRLKGFDYSQPGYYFVTICTHKKNCILGRVIDNSMVLNDLGLVVNNHWQWLGKYYDYVEIDKYVIMPNHMHGIIIIGDNNSHESKRKPLSDLISLFKAKCTRDIRMAFGQPMTQLWQRGYYEHVIRNEKELSEIRKYIEINPLKWSLGKDKYYPR